MRKENIIDMTRIPRGNSMEKIMAGKSKYHCLGVRSYWVLEKNK